MINPYIYFTRGDFISLKIAEDYERKSGKLDIVDRWWRIWSELRTLYSRQLPPEPKE